MQGEVTAVTWSKEGVISGGSDGFIVLWDPNTNNSRFRFDLKGITLPTLASKLAVSALDFHEGRLIAGTTTNEIIEISIQRNSAHVLVQVLLVWRGADLGRGIVGSCRDLLRRRRLRL